jgi:hypothetical protein
MWPHTQLKKLPQSLLARSTGYKRGYPTPALEQSLANGLCLGKPGDFLGERSAINPGPGYNFLQNP